MLEFYWNFNILMCVKSFRIVKILEQKTRVQIVGSISSITGRLILFEEIKL